MAKTATHSPFAALGLDPQQTTPMYRQLYHAIRAAILSGRIGPGTRLPATRTLAQELGVARNTVMTAFEQLLAEGYLQGRIGAGTFVTDTLPDDLLHAPASLPMEPQSHTTDRTLSQRGQMLATTPVGVIRDGGSPRAFLPGLPALDAFPIDQWSRLSSRRWRHASADLLGYGDPAGYGPLREAIAAYVGAARGVRCTADQVIVVSGAQQALDLAARLLLDPDDVVWIEDPGYLSARGVLRSAGAQLVPVPVDREGLCLDAAAARTSHARMVYISPSHQYPLGVTMSLARRLALLEWAERNHAWIVEDDYDSEFRYAGRPLAALQGLDHAGRVLYIGTFSKVLVPALRLGYLIVPPDLIDAFTTARTLLDRHAPTLTQAVLADFIVEGHFARHIRRMRALYAERQAALVAAARQQLAGLLDVEPAPTGLHLVGWLPASVDDQQAARQAAHYGIEVPPLSAYSIAPLDRGGLVLGYAAIDPDMIRQGVDQLAQALAPLARSR